jgi:hypothetical protein
MSPTDLKTWRVSEGLSKQALTLEGFDGASLLSASDEELSEVDGWMDGWMAFALRCYAVRC